MLCVYVCVCECGPLCIHIRRRSWGFVCVFYVCVCCGDLLCELSMAVRSMDACVIDIVCVCVYECVSVCVLVRLIVMLVR